MKLIFFDLLINLINNKLKVHDTNLLEKSLYQRQLEILKQKNDDDNGYYGSSDYSDNNSIKKSLKSNTDKLYSISSPTSSTVSTSTETTQASTTPSSCSTASSSPSLKPQQQQQIIPNTTADVKIYFERFERIYNSVSQDDDKANRRNSFTTCSYV